MTLVESLLLEFNKDPQNRKLQDFYSRKAMMEINGVARKEESHSAFWAWLLNGKDVCVHRTDSPFMWFLQVLVMREYTRKNSTLIIPNNIKTKILNRTLVFNILEVKVEKKIKDVSGNYFSANYPGQKAPEDELDIYIKCDYENGNILEVFIENKVTSPEEGPKDIIKRKGYDDQPQTIRYYNATSGNGTNLKLYVYLCPDHLNNISKAKSKSDDYLQISYQDLLDYILTPMIQNEDLSDRSRFLIQEYIDGLSIPTLDEKERNRIVMAITPEEVEIINKFMKRNKQLLFLMLKTMIKRSSGGTLTNDDILLINFAESNKNLIYAVYNICDDELKEDFNLDALYAGSLPKSKRIKNKYLIEPLFGIYNDSTVGFEFATIFARYCKEQLGIVTATELNKKLNDILNLSGKKKISIYFNKKKNHNEEIQGISSTANPLYAVKNNWKPEGNLRHILNHDWSNTCNFKYFIV